MAGRRLIGQARVTALAVLVSAVLLAVLLAAGNLASTTTTGPAAAEPVSKPNVVVFLLDDATLADERYLAGAREELGSEGLTFTRAISQNPLCCPARAQLMTGQLSHNNGVLANGGVQGGLKAMVDPDNTIGAWMHDAGYQTAYLGKYINGYKSTNQLPEDYGPDGVPTGWDHWDPTLKGLTNYWHFATYQECPILGDAVCVARQYAERRYTTTVERDKTLALVDRFHDDDAPFFLFTSWTAPHKDNGDQYDDGHYPRAPQRYHRPSDGAQFDRLIASKPSYNEKNMSDKTSDLDQLTRAQVARNAKPNFKGRVAALRAADEAITQVIQRLKELDEFDDTLVILTSDNGFLNGEHRLIYKKWEFRESLDVPLIMAWPDGGLPVGVTDRSASLVDLPATVLAAAGATSRRTSLDGTSLLDTLPTTTQRYQPRPLLIGSGRDNTQPGEDGWSYQGVQWGPYTWTVHQRPDGKSIGEQFYDLGTDPYQLRSQDENPWYRKNIIVTLEQYFDELAECAGTEQCVLPDRAPIVAHDPDRDRLWSWYEKNLYGTDPGDPDTDGDHHRDDKDRHPLDRSRH